MKLYLNIFLVLILINIYSCSKDKTQSIIDESIEVHGGDLFNKSSIMFDFRDKHYTYQNEKGRYQYTRTFLDTLGNIKDVLTNDGFERSINEKKESVDEEWAEKYANSVNSVIYFALLPYGLNDGAVQKEYIRLDSIKGHTYHLIKIGFLKEGGGQDYSDEFYYFFNVESKEVDYLAYTYETDGGGIRFREAYNKRNINGVLFQDYINYSPEKSIEKQTSLEEIVELYKSQQLKELSRIELENIKIDKMF